MKLVISNYMGISRAEIMLEQLTLVAGLNGNGKSSIAQALASSLTLSPLPIGVKKGDAKSVVHDGSNEGIVSIFGEKFETRIFVPKGTVASTGAPEKSSLFAVGLLRLSEMDEKERAKTLIEYLKTSPTMEDLGFALEQKGLVQYRDALWGAISTKGWDMTLKDIQEKGTKAKGVWEAATGENFGSAKSKSWQPEILADMRPEDYGLSPGVPGEEIDWEDRRVRAQSDYEAAIALTAVSQDQIDSWNLAIKDGDDAATQLIEAIAQASENQASLSQHLAINRPSAPMVEKCPHCSKGLVIKNDRVEKSAIDPVDPIALAGRQENYDLEKQRLETNSTLSREHRDYLQSRVNSGLAAKQKIVGLKDTAPVGITKEKAKADLDNINKIIAAKTSYEAATKASKVVSETEILIDIMSPTGLRKQKLVGALDAFNSSLEHVCGAASWKIVKIETDFSLTYGGRPYRFVSRSEKYRLDAVMQVAFTLIDQSAIMIFDEADILDQAGRNGLFKMLADLQLPSLVCMMMSGRDKVPNLEKAGLGNTYWVSDGIAEECWPKESNGA